MSKPDVVAFHIGAGRHSHRKEELYRHLLANAGKLVKRLSKTVREVAPEENVVVIFMKSISGIEFGESCG
jgi:hypothetical protein